MKNLWEVLEQSTKPEDFLEDDEKEDYPEVFAFEVEISVVAVNNKKGHEYGWDGTDKVVLLDAVEVDKATYDYYLMLAKVLCDALNEKEIEPLPEGWNESDPNFTDID